MEKLIRVIGELLEERAKKYGDKTFLYFRDEQVSYRELNVTSNRVSNGLLKLGVKKEDNVSIMLPNCPEFLYSWFGLAKIGAVNVPVNSLYKGEFLRYIIDHSDSKAIIMHNQFLERLKLLEKELPKLEKVILVGGESQVEVGFTIIPFEELLKSPDTSPKIEVGQYDVDAIIYTSGTTGPPKGVLRTHGYSCHAATFDIQTRGTSSDDILYTCLPLFHQNAQLATTLPSLMAGASMALAERFSASHFWDDIRKYKATQFNLIGAMLNYLYKQPPKENDKDQPARLAVGGPFSKNIYNEFRQRFNIKFLEGYGLTESGLLTVNFYDESNPKLGSFGKPSPAFDVRIVDDEDNEVPPLTVGEIVSRPKIPN
ncbi:MAG: AMP-binding protein, partial [Chloroflexota bacterium]